MTLIDNTLQTYDPAAIEPKWQQAWRDANAFQTPAEPVEGAQDVHVLNSHPFTSGAAHMGHVRSYSIGDAFYKARDALPLSIRQAAFNRYIEDPYDGAAPNAFVSALARLKRGELLSASSTGRLLSIMGNTKTGANRLKGGLKPGWSLSHKTGTGQVLGSVQAGYNDIGILTAPDGRSYAVAVMIKKTSVPLPTRMTLMNNVVRAVIDSHQGGGSAYTL